MRHLLAILTLVALAGCTVDVEGAACTVPGTTTECPTGQACGTGLTCSTEAASCTPCTTGQACRGGDVQTCSAEGDAACGTWKVTLACSAGVTTCGALLAGGPPECRCDRFLVDPAGFTAGTACRFDAVTTAITQAQRYGVNQVWLGGATGQVYGSAAADAAPIVVPAGVSVAGIDVPLAPAGRVLQVHGAGSEGVRLEAGASLAGATVRRASGGPGVGVRIAGASPGAGSSLTAVALDAQGSGGPFATGVRVEGAGAVTLTAVALRAATAIGLEVTRDTIDDVVTATDLVVDGEATASGGALGVSLDTGDLTLLHPVVKRSAGAGVATLGASVTARLTIEDGAIHDNFGTGLAAQFLGKFAVSGTKVCKNRGGAARNISGTSRLVGGAYLVGAAPSEQLVSGLSVFANDGDQVAIGLGSGTWNLAGPSAPGQACGAGMNIFAGYGKNEYGLVAASNVDATWDAWQGGAPAIGSDVLKIGTPTVLLGTEHGDSFFCALPPGLTCPAP